MIPLFSPFEQVAHLETLLGQECQLWGACLDLPQERLSGYWNTLSPQERSAAESFRFPLHRSRYIVGRGLLRQILGQYSSCPPETLRLSTQIPGGKPYLEYSDLRFNISHSGPFWVCAVTLRREVGIDLEEIQAGFDWSSIAKRYFPPEDQARLASLSEEVALGLFFTCWTRKEALAKATGVGLSDVPDTAGTHAHYQLLDFSEQLRPWGTFAASLALSNTIQIDAIPEQI